MPDTIGIAGTPVIDPDTNTAYFFAKGYQNNAAGGGIAKDGHNADIDPARYSIGGTILQWPLVPLIAGIV
ncbi:MAG: hypothetical protein Q9208_006211 [Pyrenodesmia sp. 3 TL-2023]